MYHKNNEVPQRILQFTGTGSLGMRIFAITLVLAVTPLLPLAAQLSGDVSPTYPLASTNFVLNGTAVTASGTTSSGGSDYFYGLSGQYYNLTVTAGSSLSLVFNNANDTNYHPPYITSSFTPDDELIAISTGKIINYGTLNTYPPSATITRFARTSAVIYFGSNGANDVENYGTIGDTSTISNYQDDEAGVYIQGGVVNNYAGGVIQGNNAVFTQGQGTINNYGIINGVDSNDGVLSGWVVNNYINGYIGGQFAAIHSYNNVNNYGYIGTDSDYGLLVEVNNVVINTYGGPEIPGINDPGAAAHTTIPIFGGEISSMQNGAVNKSGSLNYDAVMMDGNDETLNLNSQMINGTLYLPKVNGPMVGGFKGSFDSTTASNSNTLNFVFNNLSTTQANGLMSAIASSYNGADYSGSWTDPVSGFVYTWQDWAKVQFKGSSITPVAPYVVTNTSSDAATPGSLTYAINQAIYSGSYHPIEFAIPGTGPFVIPVTATIVIPATMDIDGPSQPGYKGTPQIILDGQGNSGIFQINGGVTTTIAGLAFVDYTQSAIVINKGSEGNFIQNNWIGLEPNGSGGYKTNANFGMNSSMGITVLSSYNTIRANTISGVDRGIVFGDPITVTTEYSPIYTSNDVQGNYIGTDPSGKALISGTYGNTTDGVYFGAGSGYTFIGPGNVISGNKADGVDMLDSGVISSSPLQLAVQGNVVFQNSIGLGADGTTPLPNGGIGVLVANGTYFNAIGGPFGGNYVACNYSAGIAVGQSGTSSPAYSIFIQNNLIGTTVSQQPPATSPQSYGVAISGSVGVVITNNVLAGSQVNGVGAFYSSYVNVSNNWIGENTTGTAIPNLGCGIYLDQVFNSYITSDYFGQNNYSNLYQEGSSNNDIQ